MVLYSLLYHVTNNAVTARRKRFNTGKKSLEMCSGSKIELKMEVKEYCEMRMKEKRNKDGDDYGDVLDSDDDILFPSLDSLGELVGKFVTLDDLLIKMKKMMESVEKNLEAPIKTILRIRQLLIDYFITVVNWQSV